MQKRTIVLGVTGGIAAYKAADLVSRLGKRGIACHVIMTDHAREFVSPLTFESLSGNPVAADMFEKKTHWDIEHIALAKRAELFVIVPATANIIGKLANGIADDMLSTTAMATKAPLILAPAMNTAMYESPAVRDNLRVLRERGALVIEPAEGLLACGDVGRGKLAPVEEIEERICFELARTGTFGRLYEGKKVLVTAGPTVEPLDPVRYLSNRSSGKMGYAFAEKAAQMGAQVVLVSGPTRLRPPIGVERVDIRTTAELMDACMAHADADFVIMAAAPADFAPAQVSDQKIKWKDAAEGRELIRMDFRINPDIIAALGKKKREGQILVAFAAETSDLLENGRKKLRKKNADYIIANDVTLAGAGFDVDTNIASLLSASGERIDFEQMSKRELAERILIKIGGAVV